MSALKPPPLRSALVTGGFASRLWEVWFLDLRKLLGNGPFPLKSYTVATVPTASSFKNHLIYVSDETGGATVAFSDGTNWRRMQDRAIIS